MSRPDAIFWRNTNHLNSLTFAPGRLIYNRVPKWICGLLVLQVALGVTLWCASRSAPVRGWTRTVTGGEAPPRPDGGASSIDAHGRAPWLTRVLSKDDATAAASWVVAQLAATLLVQAAAIPIVRGALRRHAGGLKDLFDAIRAMASGVTPKPLTAGRPGEAGFLALAFNDMLGRLLAQRKELIEANETLERKVAARTQELREAAEKLEKMAQVDALTGLPNRRALMDQGERKFVTATRESVDLVCLMIDLDNFKAVNDTLGHAKGDDVIRMAADTLRESCRPDDMAARLGGDEFTVLMSMGGISQAGVVAQRMQDEFRRMIDTAFKDAPAKAWPSMSIGITSLRSADAATLADLMSHADTALYQAKNGGKARAQVYRKGAA